MDEQTLSKLTSLVHDWLAVFYTIQLPQEYDTILGTCVDPGFPATSHTTGQDGDLDQQISNLSTRYSSHHTQVSNGTKFAFDLRNISAYEQNPTDDDISDYLTNGVAQVSLENGVLVVGIPGDVYANLLDGEGPAFGLPYSGEKGVNPMHVLAFNIALATYNGAVMHFIAGAHGKCGLYKANAPENLRNLLNNDKNGNSIGTYYDFMATSEYFQDTFPAIELMHKNYGYADLVEGLGAFMPDHNINLYIVRPDTVDRPH